jgi:hypothetical protein
MNKLLQAVEDELKALKSSYNTLRNAVVILPDDAEPEVGDLLYWAEYNDVRIAQALSMPYASEFKIIQRNGKPVVYESALKQAGKK